jgi:hypothetical protein
VSSPQTRWTLAGIVTVALVVGVAGGMALVGAPSGPAVSPSSARPAPAGAVAGAATPSAIGTRAAPDAATAPPGTVGAGAPGDADGAVAPAGGPAGEDGAVEAVDLGLPDGDTADPPGTDPCTALRKDRSRLHTADRMLEKMPARHANSIGAQRLRAVRERLVRSTERHARAVERSGARCETED